MSGRFPSGPTAGEIVTFDDAPPPAGESAWVDRHRPGANVAVAAANPAWPQWYETLAAVITEALGDRVLDLDHIGSTAVPGLCAKPVIDIDLTVADSNDEVAYVPALERRGFVLVVREWWWYGHRCFRHAAPACNLHVFSPGSPEVARHRIFRDWLRSHPDDLARYAHAKATAAAETRAVGGHTMDYNARKQRLVREIYARAFEAIGLTSAIRPAQN